MDLIHDFCRIIRALFELVEQRHGHLPYYAARTTEEISRTIDEIIATFLRVIPRYMFNVKIFTDANVQVADVQEYNDIVIVRYVMYYQCLLLNTNFSTQHLIKEDPIYGVIVETCPTLSSYLFIQLILKIKCEDILVVSLVHIPLDLCVEILDLIITSINDLEASQDSQAIRLIFLLIYKVYYKCLQLHLGTISEQDVGECIHKLTEQFYTLLNLLIVKFDSFYTLSTVKSLHLGIFTKITLRFIKKCMHSKIEDFSMHRDLKPLFRITYGICNGQWNYHHIIPADKMRSIIIQFDQQLANLLQNVLERVDHSEFTSWADIMDNENVIISVQRAVIIECHYFMKFIKRNNFFEINDHLFHCLQQFVGPRKIEQSLLTLEEICRDITEGGMQRDAMRELLKRYKKWDLSILDFINKKIELLKLKDFTTIVEYLHYKFAYLHTNADKYRLYMSVLKILLRQPYGMNHTVLLYVSRHFDDNNLAFLYDEECFSRFLNSIDDLNDVPCRTLLIFILLNPKDALRMLIIREIDCEFQNNVLFQHMRWLLPYYSVRIRHYNILIYVLKVVLLHDRWIWRPHFRIFMDNLLSYKMITADDLMNELYIPYLLGDYIDQYNLDILLLHIQNVLLQRKLCTPKTKYLLLSMALVRTLSLLRRNMTFSNIAVHKWIQLITDILQYLLHTSNLLTTHHQEWLLLFINVEPLDIQKVQLADTMEIVNEYEERCYVVHQRLRTNPRCHPKLRNFVQSFNLKREDFIRHMILSCVEKEYHTFAFELTFMFCEYFGWPDQMMAYETVMRITAEAILIVLTYIERFPEHRFFMLLISIMEFCHTTATIMTSDHYVAIRRILLQTLSSISHAVDKTVYSTMYSYLLKRIENVNPYLQLTDYFFELKKWLFVHLYGCRPIMSMENRIYKYSNDNLSEKKIIMMYKTYIFIHECLKICHFESHCYFDQILHTISKTFPEN
ncbi:hypothetical protein P5V15_014434 [Pogonomyrmex californicus]